MINELIIEEIKSVIGTATKPNKLWYIKEATKNGFSCRSKETGSILFFFTTRGNLKLNPDFVSLQPQNVYNGVIKFIENRFPEMKIRFSHKKPTVMLMNTSDKSKVRYSKF